MNYDKSTAAGQKRMFYEAHAQTADVNNALMDDLCYDGGIADANAGRPKRSSHPAYLRGYHTANSNTVTQ